MAERISCRNCDLPNCEGCNIYILETMLDSGKLDCLMDEHHTISTAPAVDAVPVKHGRWVMTCYTTTSKRGRVISNAKFACSECGCGNGRKQSNYCPNCGAKMDLED